MPIFFSRKNSKQPRRNSFRGLVAALALTVFFGVGAMSVLSAPRQESIIASRQAKTEMAASRIITQGITYASLELNPAVMGETTLIAEGVFSRGSVLYKLNQSLDPASTSGGLYPLRKMVEQIAMWLIIPLIIFHVLSHLTRQSGGDKALFDIAKRLVVVVVMLYLYIPWDVAVFRLISQPLTAAFESEQIRLVIVKTLYNKTRVYKGVRDTTSFETYAYGDSTARAQAIARGVHLDRPTIIGSISGFGTNNVDCATRLGTQAAFDSTLNDNSDRDILARCINATKPGYENAAHLSSLAAMGIGSTKPSQWETLKNWFSDQWLQVRWAYSIVIRRNWAEIGQLLMESLSGLMTVAIQLLLTAVLWIMWLGVIIGRAFSIVLAPIAIVMALGPAGEKRARDWFLGHAKICLKPVGFSVALILFFALYTAVFATPLATGGTRVAQAGTSGVYEAGIGNVYAQGAPSADSVAPGDSVPPPVLLPPGYDPENPNSPKLDSAQQALADEQLQASGGVVVGLSMRLAVILILIVMVTQSGKITDLLAGDVTGYAGALAGGVQSKAWGLAKFTGKVAVKGTAAAMTGGTSLAKDVAQEGIKKIAKDRAKKIAQKKMLQAAGGSGGKGGSGGGMVGKVLGEVKDSAGAARWAWENRGNNEDVDQSDALGVLGSHIPRTYGSLASEGSGGPDNLDPGSLTQLSRGGAKNLAALALAGMSQRTEDAIQAAPEEMWAADNALDALSPEEQEIANTTGERLINGATEQGEDYLNILAESSGREDFEMRLNEQGLDIGQFYSFIAEDADLEMNITSLANRAYEDMGEMGRIPTVSVNGREVPDILLLAGRVPALAAALEIAKAGRGGYFREKVRRKNLTRDSGVRQGSLHESVLHIMDARIFMGLTNIPIAERPAQLQGLAKQELRRIWYRQATPLARKEAGLAVIADGELGEQMAMRDQGLGNKVEWLKLAEKAGGSEQTLQTIGLSSGQLVSTMISIYGETDFMLSRNAGAQAVGLDSERFLVSGGTVENYRSEEGAMFRILASWRPGAGQREVYQGSREMVEEAWRGGLLSPPVRGKDESEEDFSIRREVEMNRLIFTGLGNKLSEKQLMSLVKNYSVIHAYQELRTEANPVLGSITQAAESVGVSIQPELLPDTTKQLRIVPDSPIARALANLPPESKKAEFAAQLAQVLPAVVKGAKEAAVAKTPKDETPPGFSTLQMAGLIGFETITSIKPELIKQAVRKAWAERGDELKINPPVAETREAQAELVPVAGSLLDIVQTDAASVSLPQDGPEVYAESVERLVQAWEAGVITPVEPRREREPAAEYEERLVKGVSEQLMDPFLGAALLALASPNTKVNSSLDPEEDDGGYGPQGPSNKPEKELVAITEDNISHDTILETGEETLVINQETGMASPEKTISPLQEPGSLTALGGKNETTKKGRLGSVSRVVTEAFAAVQDVQSANLEKPLKPSMAETMRPDNEEARRIFEEVMGLESLTEETTTTRPGPQAQTNPVTNSLADPASPSGKPDKPLEKPADLNGLGASLPPLAPARPDGRTEPLPSIKPVEPAKPIGAAVPSGGSKSESKEKGELRPETQKPEKVKETKPDFRQAVPAIEIEATPNKNAKQESRENMAEEEAEQKASEKSEEASKKVMQEDVAPPAGAVEDTDFILPPPVASENKPKEPQVAFGFDPETLQLFGSADRPEILTERVSLRGAAGGKISMTEPVYGLGAENWIKAQFNDPNTPTAIIITVDPKGLAPGDYEASLPVTVAGASRQREKNKNLFITLRLSGTRQRDDNQSAGARAQVYETRQQKGRMEELTRDLNEAESIIITWLEGHPDDMTNGGEVVLDFLRQSRRHFDQAAKELDWDALSAHQPGWDKAQLAKVRDLKRKVGPILKRMSNELKSLEGLKEALEADNFRFTEKKIRQYLNGYEEKLTNWTLEK